jgi:hypothetical protein
VFRLLALEPVRIGKLVLKVFRLENGEFIEDELEAADIEDAVFVEISAWEEGESRMVSSAVPPCSFALAHSPAAGRIRL